MMLASCFPRKYRTYFLQFASCFPDSCLMIVSPFPGPLELSIVRIFLLDILRFTRAEQSLLKQISSLMPSLLPIELASFLDPPFPIDGCFPG
jgi:hypothetical protein